MFRSCLITSLLCVFCLGNPVKSFSDVTGSNPEKFTIAFDGYYYYIAAAGKPEYIYKLNLNGNFVAQSPTPLADFRALTFWWPTGELIGKTADSGNTSSGHGIYVIDRNTLTLGNRISNQIIGIPDSAPTYNRLAGGWDWWNTSIPQVVNTPLLEYLPNKPVRTKYPFPNVGNPAVTPATRLHFYFKSDSWFYFSSTTFWEGNIENSVSYPSNMIHSFPNLNSTNFLGITDDGLFWLYDVSVNKWEGYYFIDSENTCDFFTLSNSDQLYCDPTRYPSNYPNTCYGTNAYFNYSDGTPTFQSCKMNFIRYWVLWDLWGNTATINQSVVINNPGNPSTLVPSNPNNLTCETTNPFTNATLSTYYACGPVSYTDVIVKQGCPNNYTWVRQWTYLDFCTGNITIYNQTAVYRDHKAPIIPPISNITVDYGQSVSPPNATDDCTPPTDIIISYKDTTLFSGGCTSDTLVSRVWSFTDPCNNTATITQFITIRAPFLQIPADISLECTESPPQPNVTGWASGLGNYSVTWSDSVYTNTQCNINNPLYFYITRTWYVNDVCGNRTGVQHISLQDKLDPDLQVPQNIVVSCSSSLAPSSTGYATSRDMCAGNINVTYSDVISGYGKCNQDQNITRTWATTDKCGHTVTKQQLISQVDTIAPHFVLPPHNRAVLIDKKDKIACDITKILTIIGNVQINVTIVDNCDPAPTQKFSYDWTCDYILITWTLEDACNNINTSVQNISLSSTNEGFALVYPSLMLLALLVVGGRMFF